ncbi:MAG: S8 family peptidase [Lachnospiraceae bacterium]|nr:S8 family peptidase [Lachnospiraceae bacterium]
MPDTVCRERILSEEYMDFIIGEDWTSDLTDEQLSDFCIQEAGYGQQIVYLNQETAPPLISGRYFYENIPAVYIPLSTGALDAAGILRAANQPVLNLEGQGVIIAFADTGIDYTHPAFLDENGQSRIIRIWDQTIQSGTPPKGLYYGTEFTREQLNEALASENPMDVVRTTDTNGHGTYVAGAAAGSRVVSEGERYQGAAPRAEIAVVRLKPAKQYLRQYYQIPESAQVYQENDILLALRYFLDLQEELDRPMVVCFTMGTNLGGHDGGTPLGRMLNNIAREQSMALVAAAGNEAARAHHYHGTAYSGEIPDTVELQVAENEAGLFMEVWPDSSELVTIAVISPSGQRTEKFNIRLGVENRLQFVLEGTMLSVNFWFSASGNGNQIITLQFSRPAPGLWRILVYSVLHYDGGFHIWLPAEDLIRADTIFLKPDIDVTLTDPSAADHVITAGAYNHVTDSIYLQSGRGKTRTSQQQPALAAPGTAIDGPSRSSVSGYESRTGTSAAAAITAGAAASVLTWGIINRNLPIMTGTTVKFFLTVGAVRQNNLPYPNNEWGYGKLNLYRVFEVLSNL